MIVELKEDLNNEISDFEDWEELLSNIDELSPADMFHYGVVLTKQIDIYEQQKRETRRVYNIAVENYNKIIEISERIKETLWSDLKAEGSVDFTEERKEWNGNKSVEELTNEINGVEADGNSKVQV